MNQYFDFHQTPANQRLLMASYHMEGEALIWNQHAINGGRFNGWESLVKALLVRFGLTVYNDPKEVLIRLKHITTVDAYKAQF